MRALAHRRLAFVLGFVAAGALALVAAGRVIAQSRGATVPTDVQMPGTQPDDVLTDLHTPNDCANCHGNFNTETEPSHLWRGSMMSHASRDPIFWATLAIAEQDFAGGGDFCLRCHVPSGWLAGRSVPTDGAALDPARDVHGVECDQCHRLANPDNSEFVGVQNPPFVANSGGATPVGYYGSGQYVMWNGPPNGPPYGPSKLGPYSSTAAPHTHAQSLYHRSSDLCGTCHDVSNPLTGDLAPGNGAQVPLAPGTFSGVAGTPVDGKAAFNNFPYLYGVVERTYSEHRASTIDTLPVSQLATLPAELQQGALAYANEQALQAGTGGNFADGTTRYFTCQSCHMAPTVGEGCAFGSPTRSDLARHDLTGGNYWMPDAIQWLDQQGLLILGGGLTAGQITAMNDGKVRAQQSLSRAAALSVTGNTLRVVNLTGHKLITGYPEGRRMWVNARWYDAQGALLREDGAYGPLAVAGLPAAVRTLLDLSGANTRVYEAHGGISQAWAQKLINVLGVPPSLVVAFDRVSGLPTTTLADVAAQPPGTAHESFHFLLNDTVMADNRVPPYGMSYDEARTRNALPVPATQFGNPGPGGTYQYFDQIALNPPLGATFATFDLLYQPTSWEYVQFLWKANTGSVVRLAQEGVNLRDAWLNTGMAEPHRMAGTVWGTLSLSAGDCQVAEGNAGTTPCSFVASLTAPSNQAVTVDFATADGTATVAGNDYVAASGTVTFPPGSTSRTVDVLVNGDIAAEPHETFTLTLSNATNAAIGDGTGVATIQDDDGLTASISGCTVVEGNAGSTACVGTITLNVPAPGLIVEWGTTDFTAAAGADYVTSGGFWAFQPGQTSQNVMVPVIGDVLPEIDETFVLWLEPGIASGASESVATITDDDGLTSVAELSHGFTLTTNLAAQPGGVADRDLYVIAQQPYSSYEVVVDATSGDLGSAGPLLERRAAADALLQASVPAGTGSSRTLRWQNTSFPVVAGERIVVGPAPGGCGATCGPDDVYRIRAWDTTYSIPRFNNAGSQVTVLIIENPGSATVAGHVWLWRNLITAPVDVPFTLGPRGTLVLNTATMIPGLGGSITVTHDGSYGALAGKTVALEPSTGFSFDSPMIPRPR